MAHSVRFCLREDFVLFINAATSPNEGTRERDRKIQNATGLFGVSKLLRTVPNKFSLYLSSLITLKNLFQNPNRTESLSFVSQQSPAMLNSQPPPKSGNKLV